MASIVLHCPQFGRDAEGVRYALGGALVVGRETYAHMAVIEDRVVWAISLLDLIERMGDQETLQVVSRHEGERRFEEVEAAEGGEFVKHQQDPMPAVLGMQLFCQAPADLIEEEADERLGPADVGRRHHEVERRWPIAGD